MPACLTWQITAAGRYRILFVLMDTRQSHIEIIALAGHELRHALEVLADSGLRTTADLVQFHTRGRSGVPSRAVETEAAVATRHAVFRELRPEPFGTAATTDPAHL